MSWLCVIIVIFLFRDKSHFQSGLCAVKDDQNIFEIKELLKENSYWCRKLKREYNKATKEFLCYYFPKLRQ